MGTLSGIYDVLNGLAMLSGREGVPSNSPFRVQILGETADPVRLASGITIPVHGSVRNETCDVVIVPSLLVPDEGWSPSKYPAICEHLITTHQRGGTICSACSGLFLIAETGLFDGIEATVYWPYARMFEAQYPRIPIRPDRALVVAGERGELITSGASTSWHDLVLYLVSREAGTIAAQTLTKFFALQRHADHLTPYIVFDPPTDHGDALIRDAQDWLNSNASVANPVRQVMSRYELSERGFFRRFRSATGLAPSEYVQRLRVEDAKRRLERTVEPIDEIAWHVGYQDPAAFRRVFRRLAGVSPGKYRRQFSST